MANPQAGENPEQLHPFVRKLRMHRQFFHRTLSCFREEDASFRLCPGAMTVSGQVLHAAGAIEFFVSGLFGPFEGWSPQSKRSKGFVDMSWTERSNVGPDDRGDSAEVLEAQGSLKKAVELFDRTIDSAMAIFGARSMEELTRGELDRNPLFPPGFTVAAVFEMMIDHTAHHRGALAQYARSLGLEPKIPYFDMSEARHEAQLITGAEQSPRL
ncbi:DinB family protein [Hyalangium versicolor]|uniref:DinB family protein n=1 Tax=Hyalangium versicolor TaxID=2861190 RepID=UPI001CCD01B4|nr:DinB family protein [Hyalangium versicolor]